jgi:hypothetical protein
MPAEWSDYCFNPIISNAARTSPGAGNTLHRFGSRLSRNARGAGDIDRGDGSRSEVPCPLRTRRPALISYGCRRCHLGTFMARAAGHRYQPNHRPCLRQRRSPPPASAGWTRRHLGAHLFDEELAAAELPTLRAIASADIHNLVFQHDYRIIPAMVSGRTP